MRKDHCSSSVHFHLLCRFLFAFSVLSSVLLIFWSQSSASCIGEAALNPEKRNESFHLLAFPSALNQLSFSAKPPRRLLKVALFVKRWPHRNLAGGLERHALTLHLALARRGHEIHVFTTKSNATFPRHKDAAMSFHQTPPSPAGYLNQALAWEQFQTENATGRPFDVIHSESVGLLHGRARNISNLAASWHGIAYETIHSDVVQDLLRGPDEPRRPDRASLVIGLAGRLVKDKGHPLMFEALKQVFFGEEERFQRGVFVLVAGDGPWGNRYKELGRNIIVLGPLEQSELAKFYNSLDVYFNPTLRAQGLDHTFIEAMLSGVAIAGTRFASITGSLIVGSNVGYTFLPTVESLKEALYKIMKDGKQVLWKKGEVARSRALHLFTATKMAAAYERLFLCISKEPAVKDNIDYCRYPLPWDSGLMKLRNLGGCTYKTAFRLIHKHHHLDSFQ